MVSRKKILIVEDDESTRMLLSLFCDRNGYHPVICATAEKARESAKEGLAAMILDLGLPDADGVSLLREVLAEKPGLPCFILTIQDSARAAVSCLKSGATDYFTKPFNPGDLFKVIGEAIARDPGVAVDTRKLTIPTTGGDLEWHSEAGKRAQQLAINASRNSAPVLLTGPPGTGKSAMARMIHNLGANSQGQFRAVDAESLEPDALHAELFGHDAGPSGRAKQGQVEFATAGTLYIAAVDKLSPALQSELLEMLESGRFRRMNSDCFLQSECRVVCGSSADLEHAAAIGRFRKDLLFRLKTPGIELQPLKQRIDDLPIFCELFLTRILVRDKRPRLRISGAAMQELLKYHWPGNLDELNHTLESACIHCTASEIQPDNLPYYARRSGKSRKAAETVIGSSSIEDVERASLLTALSICRGNRRLAAQRLGVSLRTIYNMIERHQLKGGTIR